MAHDPFTAIDYGEPGRPPWADQFAGHLPREFAGGPVQTDAWLTAMENADGWHVITATDKRIECVPGCDGPAPHLSEYRASDVNPNR